MCLRDLVCVCVCSCVWRLKVGAAAAEFDQWGAEMKKTREWMSNVNQLRVVKALSVKRIRIKHVHVHSSMTLRLGLYTEPLHVLLDWNFLIDPSTGRCVHGLSVTCTLAFWAAYTHHRPVCYTHKHTHIHTCTVSVPEHEDKRFSWKNNQLCFSRQTDGENYFGFPFFIW